MVVSLLLACSTAGSCGLVAGCGLGSQLKEGMAKSEAVKEDIKKELGVDANVGFFVRNGNSKVTITLAQTPPGEARAIKAQVEGIVKRHFPDVNEIEVKL
jgi:hypothetical protein